MATISIGHSVVDAEHVCELAYVCGVKPQGLCCGADLIGNGSGSLFYADFLRESLNAEPALLKILVVDDHTIVRDGLGAARARTGMDVVGSVGTGAEAVEWARRLRPDVVIMDLVLHDFSGLDATRSILSELPATRIIRKIERLRRTWARRRRRHVFREPRGSSRARSTKR